jgi:secreted trypsin-like serine protease
LLGYGATEDEPFGTLREGMVTMAEYSVGKFDGSRFSLIGSARACRGDSGGAFIVDGKVAGITSLGDPLCHGQYKDTVATSVADIYTQLDAEIHGTETKQ